MITRFQHKKRPLPLGEGWGEGLARTGTTLTLFLFIVLCMFASPTFAQTSSFTYQGRLTDGGTAANGNYDLQFVLFDSLSGGAQVGSTQTLNTVAVSNGVFTVSLDFGANAFNGANRFLEISARPLGGGAFTLLSPRQQITSTPYAVRSLNAASADSIPASGVPAGSGNYIQNTTTPQASSNFSISGNGTAGGTLSGNFVNATTQYNLDGIRVLGNRPGINNLFAGFNAGKGLLSSSTGNSLFGTQAGQNTFGSYNSFFGDAAGGSNTSGSSNTAVGSGADVNSGNLNNATAIGACALVTQSDSLILGSTRADGRSFCNTNALRDTNVGIGTTAPTARLSVVATGDGARVLHLGTERGWVFRQSGTGAATALELTGDDANNNNKNFVIKTDGNVGIGTTGPLDRLHIIGDIRVGVFGTNGCLKNNNGGTIVGTCSSDLRFKRDLVPFEPLLPKLTRLQPKYFFWRAVEFPQKQFGAAREAGLVAQEVEQVLPELVSADEQGYKLVDYSKLPLMLLQAIKEQQAQIEQQRKLIDQQHALAVRQRQQLNALKSLACRSHRRAPVCK